MPVWPDLDLEACGAHITGLLADWMRYLTDPYGHWIFKAEDKHGFWKFVTEVGRGLLSSRAFSVLFPPGWYFFDNLPQQLLSNGVRRSDMALLPCGLSASAAVHSFLNVRFKG